jgi:DNA polymerase III delta prime subunit
MQEPMHAYLITGGSVSDRTEVIEKRLQHLEVKNTDIVYLTDESEHIGIDAVRAFEKRLSLTPYQSPHIAGVILRADRLTTEAQNALLKILEEPPKQVVFFVETTSSDLLLPTIVSRLMHVTGEVPIAILTADNECKQTIQQILSSTPGKKLTIIESISTNRGEMNEWIEKAIITSRAMMLEEPDNKTILQLTKKLMRAHGEMQLNINPHLVLDNVFLSL